MLQHTTTVREFEEWKLFLEMEPQDPERSDLRMAKATSDILGGLGVKTEDRQVKDLMVTFQPAPEPEEQEKEVEIKVKSWLFAAQKRFQ